MVARDSNIRIHGGVVWVMAAETSYARNTKRRTTLFNPKNVRGRNCDRKTGDGGNNATEAKALYFVWGRRPSCMVWEMCMTWCMDNCVSACVCESEWAPNEILSRTIRNVKQLSMCNVCINFCDIGKFNFVSVLRCFFFLTACSALDAFVLVGIVAALRYERFALNNKLKMSTRDERQRASAGI